MHPRFAPYYWWYMKQIDSTILCFSIIAYWFVATYKGFWKDTLRIRLALATRIKIGRGRIIKIIKIRGQETGSCTNSKPASIRAQVLHVRETNVSKNTQDNTNSWPKSQLDSCRGHCLLQCRAELAMYKLQTTIIKHFKRVFAANSYSLRSCSSAFWSWRDWAAFNLALLSALI